MSIRFLADISGHGFGHLMQTLPVLQELLRGDGDIEIVVRSGLEAQRLRAECMPFGDFEFAPGQPVSVFPVMSNSFEVDVAATRRQCQILESQRLTLVGQEVAFLKDQQIDVVLANICPFSLAAARQLGLPAIAMCSLNWAAVLRGIGDIAETCSPFIDFIEDSYRACDAYIMPQPHIPGDDFPNRQTVEAIARQGTNRRKEILQQIGVSPQHKLVVVSSGGMNGFPFPIDIPVLENVAWVLPDGLYGSQEGMVPFSQLQNSAYIDVITSADVLVMKPGYGLVVEAVANGVKMALIERHGWIDVVSLERWAREKGCAVFLQEADFAKGGWGEKVECLLKLPRPEKMIMEGDWQAARLIMEILRT